MCKNCMDSDMLKGPSKIIFGPESSVLHFEQLVGGKCLIFKNNEVIF